MNQHEEMAKILEHTGAFRVLRRLTSRTVITPDDGSELKNGLVVDVETTGLDPNKDEIIELAMVPFSYSLDGRIFDVKPHFQGLQQPSKSIPDEITRITGITNEMVAGKSIDLEAVNPIVSSSDIIIAHNASFDRRFLEKFCDAFILKPWGCTFKEIPWKEEGFDGAKLGYLANSMGFFFDAHRASDDCLATLELLSKILPIAKISAFGALLKNARETTYRVWAENSPFDFKDLLKARGYRWNSGNDGRPKSWYLDINTTNLESELSYLKKDIYQREQDIVVTKLTAFDRYSARV
jgi:DNA polymerase-3 subunit epsilon